MVFLDKMKIRRHKRCRLADFSPSVNVIIFSQSILLIIDIGQWRMQDFLQGDQPLRGRQPITWPIFPKSCMKMKKFWP